MCSFKAVVYDTCYTNTQKHSSKMEADVRSWTNKRFVKIFLIDDFTYL